VKKLTIIEDDTDALKMAVFTFENNGYEVFRSTRETAIDDVIRIKPHIIVIGAELSNTPGNDLCIRLKANEQTGQIPIILYSATKTVDEISKRSCADGHIAKPLELEDFVYLVHRTALS
jgi:DNA-binding response OmpR family regulator